MRYINKLTGATVETNAVISGLNWEKVEVKKQSNPEEVKEEPKETKKKVAKK